MDALAALLQIAGDNRLTSDDFARALSFARVRSLKNAGQHPDGGGLVLHVSGTGAKSWRYRFRIGGAGQTLTIGAFPAVSIDEARQAHRAARWLVARGIHPLHHIRELDEHEKAQAKAKTENTFRAVCERWMVATASNLAPRTVKHRAAMLEKHVLPEIGDRPIDEIKRKELHTFLIKIDQQAPVTARHCRGYVRQVFEYAEDAEIVDSNPTPRAAALVNAAKRSEVPRKALPLNRLGEFLHTLDTAPKTDPQTKAALRLLVLTWCRTSEVTSARWDEFDLDAALWVIPGARMKSGEAHTIRLSRQAVELLRGLKASATGDVVFPNRRQPSRPMSRMTLTNWRKRWGYGDTMDVHGLRALASTWANEAGAYRPDVIEVALAHKEADRVRRAYNRAKFAEDLRTLWQDWADLCDEKLAIARAGNIVMLPSKAA